MTEDKLSNSILSRYSPLIGGDVLSAVPLLMCHFIAQLLRKPNGSARRAQYSQGLNKSFHKPDPACGLCVLYHNLELTNYTF